MKVSWDAAGSAMLKAYGGAGDATGRAALGLARLAQARGMPPPLAVARRLDYPGAGVGLTACRLARSPPYPNLP